MILENENFSVRFDEELHTVFFTGTLRLQGRDEYREISRLLTYASACTKDTLCLDMQNLQFLNSSGISTLSLFIIEMRKQGKPVRIIGSAAILWQAKSLHNFQRLYPGAEITISRPEDE